MSPRKLLTYFFCIFCLLSAVYASIPASLDPTFDVGTGPFGTVNALAEDSAGRLIVAGNFNSFNGISCDDIIRLNPDGSIDNTFNTTLSNSFVKALRIQPDGKILVGGSTVGAKDGIARLNSDGSLDTSFDASAVVNDDVHSIALQPDGKILIGGEFTRKITRLNANGSPDTSFDVGAGASSTVYALNVLGDGKILVGGSFTSIDGISRLRLARLNVNGSVDESFGYTGTGASGSVYCIEALENDQIVIGGYFSYVNGISRKNLASLDANGAVLSGYSSNINNPVYSLQALDDGRILIAGNFTETNTATVGRVALLHANGDIDQEFDTSVAASGTVYTAKLSSGKLFIGGAFNSYGGSPINHITRIWGPDESSQPACSSLSQPYGQAGETITIHGSNLASLTSIEFTDGVAASYTVTSETSVEVTVPAGAEPGPISLKSNLNDEESPEWFFPIPGTPGTYDPRFNVGTGATGTVMALAEDSAGRLIVAGSFSSFNGISCNDIIRLNPDGSVDNTFARTLSNSNLTSLKIQPDGKILVGGDTVGTRKGIARLNSDGSLDTSFDASSTVNDDVHSIVLLPDGKILIGGSFTRKIARLHADGSPDTSFDVGSGASSTVYALKALDGGQILAGGSFSSFNGATAKYLIKLNADGSMNPSFKTLGSGISGTIYDLDIQANGMILAGGSFSYVDGSSSYRYLARFDASGALDVDFTSTISSYVYSLSKLNDGRIAVGGNFTAIDGFARNYVAVLHADGSLDHGFNTVNGPSDSVRTIVTHSDSSLTVGGTFASVSGQNHAKIAKLFGDNSQVRPSIASFSPTSSTPGETITIYGSNLLDVSMIEFSGGSTASFTPLSDLSGQVIIPAEAMSGPIVAQNPYGTDQSQLFFQRNDSPSVSISSLPTVPVYAGDAITITGQNFYEVTGVLIGVLNADFEILSATSMSITVPAGALTESIILLSPSGNVSSSSELSVAVIPPSFTEPMTASGTVGEAFSYSVNINGEFDSVEVAPLPAGLVFQSSNLKISGTPEADGVFSIDISASNSGGTNTATLELTIAPPPPPAISGIAPEYSIEGGEFLVTGDNLLQTQAVTVNGASTTFRVLSNKRVAVTMPAVGGAVQLTTLQGNAVSPTDIQLWSFQSDVQSISGFGDDLLMQASTPTELDGVIAISSGLYHSLALGADGSVAAWGDNSSEQTDVPDTLAPTLIISAGGFHNLALETDGTISAWGRDDEGQCSGPNGLSGVINVATGDYHSLALLEDGTVLGWGANWSGQIDIPAGLGGVIAIDAHGETSAALKANGDIIVWGNNQFGQAEVPTEATDLIAISVGQFHILGLKADGTVVAWGMNSYGQSDIPGGLTDVVEISAGNFHSMARRSDGSVIAWGADWSGQSNITPAISDAVSISAGGAHSLILRCASSFPSIGRTIRQVTGKPNQVLSFTPTIAGNTEIVSASSLPLGTEINAMTGEISGTPAVGQDRLIRVAARNQVGYSYTPLRLFIGPYIIGWGDSLPSGMPADLTDVVELAAGDDHCLALLKDGTVVAWGNSSYGKTIVPGDLDTVVSVAAGTTYSLALKENGEVIAWGQLSNSYINPIATNAVEIDANGPAAHALYQDGTYGQIIGGSSLPSQLAQNVYAISTIYPDRYLRYIYSLAINRDGQIILSGSYSGVAVNSTGTFDKISTSTTELSYFSSNESQTHWGILRGGDLYEFTSTQYSTTEYDTLYRPEIGKILDVRGAEGHSLVLTNSFTIQSVEKADTTEVSPFYYGNQLDSTATLPGGLTDIGSFDVGPDYAIAMKEPFERPRITSTRVADARAGQSFQYQVTASTPIDEFRVTGLPTGLMLDTATGLISGVPSEAGIFNCLVIAENTDGFDTVVLSLKASEGAPPYSISLSNNSISEDLPTDTTVGMLSALDPDLADTHTFSLATGIGGTNNSSFKISGATLKTNQVLDYEAGSALSIRIQATDLGGNTFSRVFAINLINIDTDDDDLDGLTEAEEAILGTDPSSRDSDQDGAGDGTEVYTGSNPLKPSEKPTNYIATWGRNTDGQCNVPIDLGPVVAVTAGEYHTLAIKADGTVAAWGRNTSGQCNVPASLSHVIAIAAGYNHSLALKKDGTVVAWGTSTYSLNTVPTGLSDVIEIAAGDNTNFALKSDGSVVAWGASSYNLNSAPTAAVNALTLAASDNQILTLNADGSSSGWGYDSDGIISGPLKQPNLVAIATGGSISLALTTDNQLLTWGSSSYNLDEIPTELGQIQSIAAGNYLGLVIETDGTLTVWGRYIEDQTTIPPAIGKVIMADAGYGHVVALVDEDGFTSRGQINQIYGTKGLPLNQDMPLWNDATEIAITFLPDGISYDSNSRELSGIPTQTGTFLGIATAFKGYARSSALIPFEIQNAHRLSDWESIHFTNAEKANGQSHALADIDFDNVPNLLEYALFRDPKSSDRAAPAELSVSSINQQDYLTLTYERLRGAADLRYVVEVSSDLQNWESGSEQTTRVQTISLSDTEVISVRDLTPMSDQNKRFIRLRVESIY